MNEEVRERGLAPLRRQTIIKFSFNDIKDKLTKIDNKDISQVVKNRFHGLNYLTEDPDEVDKTVKEVEAPKNTIVQFIEKFGFVELNEVDNILLKDHPIVLRDKPEPEEKEMDQPKVSEEFDYPHYRDDEDFLPTKLPEKPITKSQKKTNCT